MARINYPRTVSIEARAVSYAVALIERGATDWQDVQDALSNHIEFGPWLSDEVSASQSVIRKAEKRFNGKLPSTYSD
jgi:hypothetical protein